MRTLAKFCSAKPVTRPSRNRNIPCHIRHLLVYLMILLSVMERGAEQQEAARHRLLTPKYPLRNARAREVTFTECGFCLSFAGVPPSGNPVSQDLATVAC